MRALDAIIVPPISTTHVSGSGNGDSGVSQDRMDSAIALVDEIEKNNNSNKRKGKGASIRILAEACSPGNSPILTTESLPNESSKGKETENIVEEMEGDVEEEANVCHFDKLPLEVKVKIFKCLEVVEVITASMVCRSWYNLAFDGALWSRLDVAPFYQKISASQLVALWKSAGGFLKEVNFRGCVQLSSLNVRELTPYCPNIQKLDLSGCRNLDFAAIDFLLSHLHDLEELNISCLDLKSSQNYYTRTLAKQCKKLKKVNMSWCRCMTARDVETLVKGCKKLTSLKLDGIAKLNESTFTLIGELRHLQVLSLDSCPTVDDNLIAALFQSGSNNDNSSTIAATMTTTTYSSSPPPIAHLNLSNNPHLTDTALQDIADFCPLLTHLQLHGCPGFTDSGLTYLASKCTELQAIDLEDCNTAVNDEVLEAFATHLEKLRIICLSYCDQITDEGVTNLLRECTHISRIDLDQCQSLTDTVLRNLTTILTTTASIEDRINNTNNLFNDDDGLVSHKNNNTRPRLIEIEIFDCRNISISAVRETVQKVSAAGVLLKLKGYYAWQASGNTRNREQEGNNTETEDDENSGRQNDEAGTNIHHSFWARNRIFRHLRNVNIIPDIAMRFQFQAAFRGAGFRGGQNGRRMMGQCIIL
ncbi:8351_t:CDS:2 [Ambispora leptoticha]|uniref:8351_t:CDS:1 n=1 Tax=Ambispora leptoticha TaxID=144679 RepID=A0A9N8VB76_9GLOM|nr:8351_t:CDS:2 [Ambispora leptoticha]